MKIEKILSYIGVVLLCAVSIFTMSCEKKDVARNHDLTPKSESVKVELTEQDEKEIEVFQQELSEALSNQDDSFLEKHFNINRLMEIALEGLDIPQKEKVPMLKGMRSSGASAKQQIVDMINSADARFLKAVHTTRPALLYRLILSDGSFTYGEFHLEKGKRWEIVDFFFYSNGNPTSQVVRELFAQIIPNKKGEDQEMLEAVMKAQKVQALTGQGEARKAWAKWKTISAKGHENRAVLLHGYNAAFQLYMLEVEEDEDANASGLELKEVFALIDKKFTDDAGFAILEIAIHDINEDHDALRATFDKIRKKVGNDPYLDLQEAYVDLAEEKWDAAMKKAQKFQLEEPYLTEAYSILWSACIGNKDYKVLADSLHAFTELYETEKSYFSEDPYYKEFIDSPEGQAWLNE